MKKLLLLGLMLLGLGGVISVKAKTLDVDLSALPASNGENIQWTWDSGSSLGTFAWTSGSYNSIELFGAGDYSDYATLNYVITEGTSDQFRIIVKYTNGTGQTTYVASCGAKSLSWSAIGVDVANLPYIQTIRLSGSTTANRNVIVSSVFLADCPIRIENKEKELEVTGSTFPTTTYKKFSVTKVPDTAFELNPFSMTQEGVTYDDFCIDIAVPTTVGDWLFLKGKEAYWEGFQAISVGTSGIVKLDNDKEGWTSLVLQAGNPDGARDLILKDVYFYKNEGNEKKSILASLGGEDVLVEEANEIGTKAFELTNVNVTGYEKLVISFSSPTVGAWVVNCDGTEETIPEGTSKYTIDVSNKTSISNISLSVGAGDFPRANIFKQVCLVSTNMVAMDALANDEIFSLDKATNFDIENKQFEAQKEGGWTFATPVDISKYSYLIITTPKSGNNISWGITITDDNGKSIGRGDYKWEEAETRGGGLYIDNWNHKNVVCVNLAYLKDKGMDITKISSLKLSPEWGVNDPVYVNNVILTNYTNSEFVCTGGTDQWHTYSTGQTTRTYTKEEAQEGRFGTICLPYTAVVSGAFIYSIASLGSNGINLERVDGLMEAGKPYFYQTTDNVEGKVQFFRADWSADVAEPVENNGLIGTFTDNTEVPYGKFILYNNQTYCVDSEFYVDAYRAYIDKSKIENKQDAGSRTLLLPFFDADDNDATAIEGTEAVEVLNEGVFYDMSGREVKNPTTGIYIVKYGNVTKKVMIK